MDAKREREIVGLQAAGGVDLVFIRQVYTSVITQSTLNFLTFNGTLFAEWRYWRTVISARFGVGIVE